MQAKSTELYVLYVKYYIVYSSYVQYYNSTYPSTRCMNCAIVQMYFAQWYIGTNIHWYKCTFYNGTLVQLYNGTFVETQKVQNTKSFFTFRQLFANGCTTNPKLSIVGTPK